MIYYYHGDFNEGLSASDIFDPTIPHTVVMEDSSGKNKKKLMRAENLSMAEKG